MTRRNPFDELEELFDRMQENVENAARMWDPEEFEGGLPRPGSAGMSVDLEDTGDELVLTGDLPGFETEDIDVRMVDRTLQISAERDEEAESDAGEYVRRERRHASVSRSISLPEAVDESDITARYNNGVLTVRMPKREPDDRGTRIDVN
ncbi:Hsp20/alpha crystallin family protein [Haloplanus pelagicus]|jgi:HSP20 family protein|uniref:Hsp20/alpha crystallin family protein n=1 Tax=Haloplanus pelagicus TaxID=2949995 RepID=UPI00203ACA01|nr:Hsp20/alpha crystallin family protein [Haloplanus sp. HW8-1]